MPQSSRSDVKLRSSFRVFQYLGWHCSRRRFPSEGMDIFCQNRFSVFNEFGIVFEVISTASLAGFSHQYTKFRTAPLARLECLSALLPGFPSPVSFQLFGERGFLESEVGTSKIFALPQPQPFLCVPAGVDPMSYLSIFSGKDKCLREWLLLPLLCRIQTWSPLKTS